MIAPFKTIRRRIPLMLAEATHTSRADRSGSFGIAAAIECLELEPRILMSESPAAVVAADVVELAAATDETTQTNEEALDSGSKTTSGQAVSAGRIDCCS